MANTITIQDIYNNVVITDIENTVVISQAEGPPGVGWGTNISGVNTGLTLNQTAGAINEAIVIKANKPIAIYDSTGTILLFKIDGSGNLGLLGSVYQL